MRSVASYGSRNGVTVAGVRRPARRFRGDESGSFLLEYAVTISLLLTTIFGIMSCCQALYVDHFVCDAATEGARYAMVRGATFTGTACATPSTSSCMATSANVTTYVQGLAPLGVSISSTILTVTTTWPGTNPTGTTCTNSGINNNAGCIVKVNVKYSFPFLLPFVPKKTLVLSSTSVYPIEQ